jgi:hypothetical protein
MGAVAAEVATAPFAFPGVRRRVAGLPGGGSVVPVVRRVRATFAGHWRPN